MLKLTFILLLFFIYSCSSTSPNIVKKSDTQKVTSIEYGIIKFSSPVKIKGESNWIGATSVGLIGGLLGTQVCGEEEIIGTKCQDIAVVFGTIGGVAAGTVIQTTIGNHNGFQYIITIDDCSESFTTCESNEDKAFVQGDKVAIAKGQRVVIMYGDEIRVMPYEE